MNKKFFAKLFVLFVFLLIGGVGIASAQEFSADMESRLGNETTKAKIYVAQEKVRMEMAESVMIIRNDQKVMFMVMPPEKMYMENLIDIARAPKVQKSFDNELERVSLGKETVNDQETEKFKVAYTENGKKVEVYQWLKDGVIPVKVEALDGSFSTDYKNLQVGVQPASLFEPPEDYTKMEMPNLNNLLGGF